MANYRGAKPQSSFALTALMLIASLFISAINAYLLSETTYLAQQVTATQNGSFVASLEHIADLVHSDEQWKNADSQAAREKIEVARVNVLRQIASEDGDREEVQRRLAIIERVDKSEGAAGFVELEPPFQNAMSGSLLALFLFVWWLALVLQSDGMEIDTTRRRHPMWEFFLSLPIPQSAVFAAEALSPVMSNPIYWTAPFVIAGCAGLLSSSLIVAILALPLGIPLIIAAAVCAKTNEVLIMLRLAPRTRGSWFAVLAGIGVGLQFLPLLMVQPRIGHWVAEKLFPVWSNFPNAAWLVQADTPLHWLRAMGLHVLIAILLIGLGIWLMRFGAARGLESGFGAPDIAQTRSAFANAMPFPTRATGSSNARHRWWRDPLFKKELLWLRRDRSALIQVLLVPLVLVAAQGLNFRSLLTDTVANWHRAAGLVMLCAAYMLFAAGPRALVSETSVLGTMLAWPRSLEATLHMKVRMLFAVVSIVVLAAMITLMFVFPADSWKLGLVLLVWPLYGISVAEKAVTLIRAPSGAGVPEAVPREAIWAAGLGNVAFAMGLFLGDLQVALFGLALNWVFAAALWQNFSARLPYLFDPDSQPVMQPPTVASSVIAILGMQELGVLCSIPFMLFLAKVNAPFALLIGYTLAAGVVCFLVWHYHKRFNIGLRDITRLPLRSSATSYRHGWSAGLALGIGGAYGCLALAYAQFLHSDLIQAWFPEFAIQLAESNANFAESPNLIIAYGLLAVVMAPWAEEFLFRGLMFRAMRKQWRFWPATFLSSLFFTFLHPISSWPLVFLLGATNAWLFVYTRMLWPAVLLHFVYNLIVVMGSG